MYFAKGSRYRFVQGKLEEEEIFEDDEAVDGAWGNVVRMAWQLRLPARGKVVGGENNSDFGTVQGVSLLGPNQVTNSPLISA